MRIQRLSRTTSWRRPRPAACPAAAAWLTVALLVLPLLSSPARGQAEVYLEVQKSDVYRVPIVLEDLGLEGIDPVLFDGRDTAEQILAQNLDYTDAFLVIRESPEAGFATSLKLDIHGTPVDRPVQARIRGSLRRAGEGYELHLQLLDEATGQEIFGDHYAIDWDPDRLFADRWPLHRAADQITRYLTGTQGCAATQIAYVRASEAGKELALIDWDGRYQAAVTHMGTILVSPAWHPSRERLAFTSYHAGLPLLVELDLPRGQMRTLSDQKTPSAPAYSADGRWIAYASTETGDAEIYVMRANGSERRRITFHRGIDTAPSWSPGGGRIVFTSDRWGPPQLFTINADGTDLRQLTFAGKWNDSPDWSPAGDRIVHVCRIDREFELALIHADGRGWRRLTIGGGCENPRWAPDGRHVAFARNQGGRRALWILDVDSGRVRRLTPQKDDSYNPAWSRPGRDRLYPLNPGG